MLYVVFASTHNQREAIRKKYIDEELALFSFNQILGAEDAIEVGLMDGLTGEIIHLWTRKDGFVALNGVSV